MDTKSLNVHRIKDNPLEAAYAMEWVKIEPRTLGYILCGNNRHEHDYSQRDAEVAATVIQWLGSHVGQSFVNRVLGSREVNRKSTRAESICQACEGKGKVCATRSQPLDACGCPGEWPEDCMHCQGSGVLG